MHRDAYRIGLSHEMHVPTTHRSKCIDVFTYLFILHLICNIYPPTFNQIILSLFACQMENISKDLSIHPYNLILLL